MACILLVASLFRFIGLTSAPPALNWDEVSIGYNAYSILKTGRDEWGKFLPLTFKAFGENKLPGMIYASVPGILLFGTTDLGVRVTPAILGVLSVYLLFCLARILLKNDHVALASAALLAISPWAIHFSRVSFEAGLALVLMLLSIIALVKALEQPKYLWYAMLSAIAAAYTYNAIRILLPLMLMCYLANGVIRVTKATKKTFLAIMLVGLVLLSPIFKELASPEGRVRLSTVSIISQKGFYDGISESRGYTKLPSPLPQLMHNKYTHYVYTFALNYVSTYSTDFLFLTGSPNTQRSVQGMGLLYLFEAPLLILGLIQLFKQNNQSTKIIIPWLLLSGIPSAMTNDAPSSLRAFFLLPALLLVESRGVRLATNYLKNHRYLTWLTYAIIIWCIGYFSYQLWMVNPVKYSSQWLYGYKQAVQFAQKQYPESSKIYLTARYGEPYIYTLFYTSYDPHAFQIGPVEREIDPTGWVHVKSFDKYRFSDFAGLESPQEIVSRNHGQLLMITGFAELPSQYRRDFSVSAPNWIVMFEGTKQIGQQ